MKTIRLFGLCVVLVYAGSAGATAVCSGETSPTNKNVTTASLFIANNFSFKCSSNVFVDYAESATAIGVGSGSKKGKNVFSGNSGGGGVKPTGTACPASGCTASESAAGAAAALTAASS